MTAAPPDALDLFFSPIRPTLQFQEAADRLTRAIRLGLLQPGDRLPVERDLARRMQVSRGTVRQALQELASRGYIRIRRGRGGGAFVAAGPVAVSGRRALPGDVEELLDLRRVVGMGVVDLAIDRVTAAECDWLYTLAEQDAATADASAHALLDARFHVALAEITRQLRLVELAVEVEAALVDVAARLQRSPDALAAADREHRELIAALRLRSTAVARDVLARHFEAIDVLARGAVAGKTRRA